MLNTNFGRVAAITTVAASLALSSCTFSAPKRPRADFNLQGLDIVVADPKTGAALCVFANPENENSTVRSAPGFDNLMDCDPEILERYLYDREFKDHGPRAW